MKKLLLLLLVCPLFIACSNDNNGDKGYLASLENVKIGIVGVWKPVIGPTFCSFTDTGQSCWGYTVDKIEEECSKYEIVQKENIFYIRSYQIGDTEGTGSYIDIQIKILSETELAYGETTHFKRYNKK